VIALMAVGKYTVKIVGALVSVSMVGERNTVEIVEVVVYANTAREKITVKIVGALLSVKSMERRKQDARTVVGLRFVPMGGKRRYVQNVVESLFVTTGDKRDTVQTAKGPASASTSEKSHFVGAAQVHLFANTGALGRCAKTVSLKLRVCFQTKLLALYNIWTS
jgi:hypothetical protein